MSPNFVDQNIKALVVACNTATAAAIDRLRTVYPFSHHGRDGDAQHFGQRAVPGAAGSARRQPCDGLADAIERGASIEDATEIIAACARHTGAMGLFGTQPGHIDTLVLGCTHYPFVSEHLQALVGVDMRLAETGEAVARQTLQLMCSVAGGFDQGVTYPSRIRLLATGNAYALKAAAAHWLALRQLVFCATILIASYACITWARGLKHIRNPSLAG